MQHCKSLSEIGVALLLNEPFSEGKNKFNYYYNESMDKKEKPCSQIQKKIRFNVE